VLRGARQVGKTFRLINLPLYMIAALPTILAKNV
jgi:hypothetical protein